MFEFSLQALYIAENCNLKLLFGEGMKLLISILCLDIIVFGVVVNIESQSSVETSLAVFGGNGAVMAEFPPERTVLGEVGEWLWQNIFYS